MRAYTHNDDDPARQVKALLLFLDRAKRERIGWALAGAKPPVIKYLSAKARCHETLNLIEVVR